MDEGELRELQSHLRALQAQFRRSLPPVEGVSRTAVRVLGVVARAQDAGARPGRIAEELAMTSSNVAAALRELEQAGYIARRRDAGDGRRISAVLTPRGAETVDAHRALRVGGLREAIEVALTPAEQRQLTAVIPLLGRIVEAGQKEGRK
jgi:DNA-binding MarR family transcriptional regulator